MSMLPSPAAVRGASPDLTRRLLVALRPLEGESLLKLQADEVSRLATALPDVESVSYDRAFPNTLRVRVQLEQPLAVLRHGDEWWLVSRRGRVTARLAVGARLDLPRIWLRQSVPVTLGGTLGTGGGADDVAALAPLRSARLEKRVTTVGVAQGQITYKLHGGVELRVGSAADLPLKLAIARTILAGTSVVSYLDVSVPERPVALTNPQVSGRP
jgi:hypothetical protein